MKQTPRLLKQRDYQRQTLLDSVAAYERGVNRQLFRLATGLGKTTGIAQHVPMFFPDLVDKFGMLFVAHRREILLDTYHGFRRAYPHVDCGLEMGEHHCIGLEDFVFASADSVGRVLSRRLQDKYHRRTFGVIITDEGHHVTPGSMWDNVLTYFGVGSRKDHHFRLPNGDLPLSIFLTATPNRHDGQGLYPVVDEIVADYDYVYGVREGWLVDVKQYWARDLLGVTGDEFVDTTDADFVLRLLRDHGRHHQSLVFARSVRQSQLVADTLNRLGILPAHHVDGTTDKELRKEMVADFKHGRVRVMTNYGVFREGTDLPGVTMIVDNQPTDSVPQDAQKVGRGGRPHPDARVDDFETAAERRASIAASPKPYLLLVRCFEPKEQPFGIMASLAGRDDVDQGLSDGRLLIEETLDVIEEIEEEQPERPIREITCLDDLAVEIKEHDFWTLNVGEAVAAITPLKWVFQSTNEAALYIEENPWATKTREECPVIVHFRTVETPSGPRVEKRVIEVGGWNAKLRRPVSKRVIHKGYGDSLHEAIHQFDAWITKHRPYTKSRLVRGASGPMTPEQRRYMTNAGIAFAENTSEGTADLLIAAHRIRHNLNLVDA